MSRRLLVERLQELLEMPGVNIPSQLLGAIAEKLVNMSTDWVQASPENRAAVLSDHKQRIQTWFLRPRAGRNSHVRALAEIPRVKSNGLESYDSAVASGSERRKQSLYFPEALLQEIRDEAARLDRSLSWVVQRAWRVARLEMGRIPSVNEMEEATENKAAAQSDDRRHEANAHARYSTTE